MRRAPIPLAAVLFFAGFDAAAQSRDKPSDNVTAVKTSDNVTGVRPSDNVRGVRPSDVRASDGVISGVRPSDGVISGVRPSDANPSAPKRPAAEATRVPAAPADAGSATSEAPSHAAAAGTPVPHGPAVVTGDNVMTIRGLVESVDAASITVRRRTGPTVTYQLAPGTKMPAGLKAGAAVRVRARLDAPGRVADRVERDDAPQPAERPIALR